MKIIVITGPTASGKTTLSIKLAKIINAEIICADSRIVYKDFNIVSAKPTLSEREGIVHHLIDIIDAYEEFSAGHFAKLADAKIDEIKTRNKNIIISGGTWFYIKSLLDDLALPKCEINKDLRNELEKLDSKVLWDKLNSLDSKRAQLIHPNNKDKVIRSIEMCLNLNMPISEYKRQENKKYDTLWYMPNIERDVLYQNINKRVDIMIESGLYEEWKANKEKYPDSAILKNTIGYSEFFNLSDGLYPDFNFAVDKIKQHTRNFSKRQLSYFRNNKDIKAINNIDEIMRDLAL